MITHATHLLTAPFRRADNLTRAIRALHIKSAVKWAYHMAHLQPDWEDKDTEFAKYLAFKLAETQIISHPDN